MKLKFIGAAVLTALTATATMAQETIVRMGTEGYYPPFNYFDSAGQIKGFDIDVGNALCKQMQVKCEWVTTDWDGIIPALNANKFDTIIASMSNTEERSKVVSFSKPYYYNAARFIATKDSNLKGIKPEDLKGMVFGTQSGTGEVAVIEQYYPDNELKLYPKLDDALLDLETGRVEVVLASQFVLADWLENDKSNCCEFIGTSFIEDNNRGTGIAVRQSDTKLLGALDKAIDEIMTNGTYEEIRAEYFDFEILSRPVGTSELFGK